MSTALLTQNDIRVRELVIRQLDWDPAIDTTAIGVSTRNGIVTLTGMVGSYSQKLAAERSALRVLGVRAVANDIHVRLRTERTDADIAADAARALELRATVPGTVHATVDNGCVALLGMVDWAFQRADADAAVRHIRGVRVVLNRIEIRRAGTAGNLRKDVVAALRRQAEIDGRDLRVDVAKHTATLRGTVSSWAQRMAADRAAANTPGIARVDNQIEIVPREPIDEMC